MAEPQKIRFYFSFRSPFAGIAFYRLRRSPLFNDFEFEMIPVWPDNVFGGHMDNPTDNLFKLAYVFADASRQAEEAGLSSAYLRRIADSIKLPTGADYSKEKVGLKMPTESWGITHHAFLYAQEQGKAWEFGDAVFMRRFDFDGRGQADVLDVEVLATIADQVGLDAEATPNAHASGRYDATHAAMVKQGEQDGVFGVPFFAIDRDEKTEVFWGNDRLAFLYRSLSGVKDLPQINADSLKEIQPARR